VVVALAAILFALLAFMVLRAGRAPREARAPGSLAGSEQGPAATAADGPAAAGSGRPTRPPHFVSGGARRAEPVALERFEQEHTQPGEIYDREARDPVWAPQMEATIRSDIESNLASLGLSDTAVRSLECRSSSCRISVGFEREDAEAGSRRGAVHPVELLFVSGGHLASTEVDVEPRGRTMPGADPTVAVLPDGSYEKTMILLFGKEEVDPASYRRWRSENQRRLQDRERQRGR
jgi:hypothetical protein